MRDNLFVVIELGNAHLSGVCAIFTVAEFHRSKFQEGYHMFYVNKHKTMYKYGPAVITLTPTEFEWFSTYVEKVRPQVSASDENVFLSWTEKQMEAGAVSRQLCSLWIKIGILTKNDKKHVM